MPRKSLPAVASKNPKTQTIVRSERAHLKRSAKNCRKHPRKTAKTRGSYLPEPKVLRIQQRYLNGQNKSEIAKEENIDRGTVARIVKFPEVRTFIAQMQQEFFGLIPDAMEAVRHALKIDKNPTIGLRVLEGTGVAPPLGQRLQLPEATSQDGYSRQAMLVANVMLEVRKNYGVDLPPDFQKALAKDREHATLEAQQPDLPKNLQSR